MIVLCFTFYKLLRVLFCGVAYFDLVVKAQQNFFISSKNRFWLNPEKKKDNRLRNRTGQVEKDVFDVNGK